MDKSIEQNRDKQGVRTRLQPTMALNKFKSMLLLLCLWVFCFMLSSFIIGFVATRYGDSSKAMRICAVVQDLLVFIIPAIVASLLVTRLPASLLAVDRKPSAKVIALSILTMIAAVPLLDCIIMLNQSIPLPESLAESMRSAENVAQHSINLVLGGTGVGDLVMSILLVGILAGFSEELFFRGAAQRFLSADNRSVHIAVWGVAFVFSAIHMQFYGFIPRLLLGAYFGYLLVWSGSLWVPMIAHIFNNIVFICERWIMLRSNVGETANETQNFPSAIIAVSVILTIVGIILTRRAALRTSQSV